MFTQIEIAEGIIKENDERADIFCMYYSKYLSGCPDWLFRNHCREIARRSSQQFPKKGIQRKKVTKSMFKKILDPLTNAEMLWILSNSSLQRPLTHEGFTIMQYLFTIVSSEEGIEIPDDLKYEEEPPKQYVWDMVFKRKTNPQRTEFCWELISKN